MGVILGLGCGPAKNAGTTPAKESIPFPDGELVVPAVFSLNNVAITPFCITVKEGYVIVHLRYPYTTDGGKRCGAQISNRRVGMGQ